MSNTCKAAPPRATEKAYRWMVHAIFAGLIAIGAVPSTAQDFGAGDIFSDFSLNGFGEEAKPSEWSARYGVSGSESGVIEVEVRLGANWHVYSVTQAAGGPLPTKLSIATAGVELAGPFKPDSQPKSSISDVYDGLKVEEHEDVVVWSAPITIPNGFKGPISVDVAALSCKTNGSCVPVNETLVAQVSGDVDVAAKKSEAPKAKPFRDGKYVVEWFAEVVPGTVKPGADIELKFTAKPDATYHVYRGAIDDTESSTNFVVTQKAGLLVGAPTTPSKVITKVLAPGLPAIHYHNGAVTWTLPVSVPKDAAVGVHTLEGLIAYQACTDNSCQRPVALKFVAEVTVDANLAVNTPGTVKLTSAKYAEALDAAAEAKWVDKLNRGQQATLTDQASVPPVSRSSDNEKPFEPPASDPPSAVAIPKAAGAAAPIVQAGADSPELIAEMAKLYNAEEKVRYLTYDDMAANPVGSGGVSSGNETTFWTAMFGAFVGGMLLNLMPCVFPVLGLKVMGFVKQAGSDPAKIRLHGIAFTAGLVVSMWVLASIILLVKLSLGQDINWGAQMGNPYFVCAMIVLLFVLGLNMAGVFEIGTSMTRVGGNLQGKEGYTSSFLSGVLTTLIATPCSGPFLGAAMSYTLQQSAGTAMFLFTVFALGISFPYILLCFFPVLINRLPKPGVWMETFKVTMAFAMFAVVAFFMRSFGGQTGASGLSWLAMALVLIGLAAYYYGNWTMPHIRRFKRLTCGYALPALICVVAAWMCYGAANERAPVVSQTSGGLAWKAWNPGKVEHILANQQRPVWVDYTAHWCPTCQVNKKRIFSNEEVLEKLKELNVELVKVDDTLREPRIATDLKRVDRSIIPVNLVYPPNYPEEPAILLEELISPSDALDVLARMEEIQNTLQIDRISLAQ